MKQLLVLVGLQGAGKTTTLNLLKDGKVLKPSTTRAPRSSTDSEYHFEKAWDLNLLAWSITRGTNQYGMRWAELNSIERVGITVFDPANLQVLKSSPARGQFEIITLGLDTIGNIAEQHARVAQDPLRTMSQGDFIAQRQVVQSCDVVLSGDANTVTTAVTELAVILGGRGGMLRAESIEKLVAAGSLLEHADASRIESASYDLRLADKYWCQGKYHILSPANPVAVIPPYSFAVVMAKELAALPRFIVASFDIRVRLFFSGVVLSNGPQVDPGYHGALFCMLHNASGTEVGINRDEHFASIQFQTMAINSLGYSAAYQHKKDFADFLDGSASTKPGGQIFEHVNSIAGKLESDAERFRNTHWVLMGILGAVLAIGVSVGIWVVDKAVSAADKVAAESTARVDAVVQRANEATALNTAKADAAVQRTNEVVEKLSVASSRKESPSLKTR